MTPAEQARLDGLKTAATERLAEVAGKTVPLTNRRGRKLVTVQVPAVDHALVSVDPADIRWLVGAAVPSAEADVTKVSELRAGVAAANSQAEELFLLAKDVALLCDLVPAAAVVAPAALPTHEKQLDVAPPPIGDDHRDE